jgi:hypothetical protein
MAGFVLVVAGIVTAIRTRAMVFAGMIGLHALEARV